MKRVLRNIDWPLLAAILVIGVIGVAGGAVGWTVLFDFMASVGK